MAKRDNIGKTCAIVEGIEPGPKSDPDDEIIRDGDLITARFLHRRGENGHYWPVDVAWPMRVKYSVDMWSIDEGFAAMLTGMVQTIQPEVVVETGTHRGRSAKAIVEGLKINRRGHLYTVDMDDYDVWDQIFDASDAPFVTQVIGRCPEILAEAPFAGLDNIEMAFLDGGHGVDNVVTELDYVDRHRAEQCWVLLDNATEAEGDNRGVREALDAYDKYPKITMRSMCGTEIIWMH